jgi:hypothetical protein
MAGCIAGSESGGTMKVTRKTLEDYRLWLNRQREFDVPVVLKSDQDSLGTGRLPGSTIHGCAAAD